MNSSGTSNASATSKASSVNSIRRRHESHHRRDQKPGHGLIQIEKTGNFHHVLCVAGPISSSASRSAGIDRAVILLLGPATGKADLPGRGCSRCAVRVGHAIPCSASDRSTNGTSTAAGVSTPSSRAMPATA